MKKKICMNKIYFELMAHNSIVYALPSYSSLLSGLAVTAKPKINTANKTVEMYLVNFDSILCSSGLFKLLEL